MTIILFLVDTSASMNQRTYLGARPTLLDVAKDAVEKFLKLRQRDPASRGDRYMLLTFEDPPTNIKAGWKEHHNVFMNELKNLTASGMTTLGPSLKHAFDLLNLNRMQTGIDTYGQGRCPFFLEPSVIIVISDGGRLSNGTGVQEEISLPSPSPVPGSELTKEAYRWDQRLFALVLRLTGTLPTEHVLNGVGSAVACDNSPIDAMCEETGGRSYAVSSQRSLMQCLESIVQKIQSGVVIQFEKVGADPAPLPEEQPSQLSLLEGTLTMPSMTNGESKSAWTSCRKLIYVQRSAQKGYSVGHWPIPESFWPDLNAPALVPRTAHPVIKFTCTNTEPMVIDNLPFDKYELEPSPLTQQILSRKQPQAAWQCFITNSHKSSDLGLPFGYLKASTTLNCVNLFVLPYNYPALLPLLDDLFKQHHCKPTREWKASFDAYLKNLPLYYAAPLKRALQRMGAAGNLVPDNLENCLSYTVMNYLKRLKNLAKVEYDKLVASVGSTKQAIPETIRVQGAVPARKASDTILGPTLASPRFQGLKNELNEFPNFVIRIKDKNSDVKAQCYRNPYDINRHELIDQIHRMRINFLQPPGLIKFQDEDQMHSLPVSQMGNYQEYLKKMPMPLRELESAPVRQHMFGNPFKLDKSKGMMIDEADIDLVGSGGASPVRSPKRPTSESAYSPTNSNGRPKRRPGPLPRDFLMSRPLSPSPSASPSPPPSPTLPSSPAFITPSEPIISAQNSFVPVMTEPVLQRGPVSLIPSGPEIPLEMPVIPPSPDIVMEPEPEHDGDSLQSMDAEFVPPLINSTKTYSSGGDLADLNANNSRSLDSEDEEVEKYSLVTLSHQAETPFAPERSQTPPDFVNGKLTRSTSREAMYSLSSGALNGPSLNHVGNNYSFNGKRLSLTPEEIDLRRGVFRLVKKPGRNFDDLIENLTRQKSPFKEYLIDEVKSEALRFKRKSLVEYLAAKFSECNNVAHNNGNNVSSASNNSNSIVGVNSLSSRANYSRPGKTALS